MHATYDSSPSDQLAVHKQALEKTSISELFSQQADRFNEMSCSAAGITLDYSKNIASSQTLELLFDLARQRQLEDAIQKLVRGAPVNVTEARPALHTALRNPVHLDEDVAAAVGGTFAEMEKFVRAVHEGEWRGFSGERIRDVVNIGIGGSDLGPLMVTEALKPYKKPFVDCHFVSNVDAGDLSEVLKSLNPRTTLFIIASKTFTTLETLTNASTAREWLVSAAGSNESVVSKHFVAVSANVAKAVEFGVVEDNVFPMWDWVGGRYSLWSAIGLPIALAVGMDNFNALRAGAGEMDKHFTTAPLEQNMPVIMGLLGVWYVNFWDAHTHAVLPYDHYLRFFTKYLQQLDMESNGKRAVLAGGNVDGHTGPVIWGDVGTNGQHSFHQLLHQGTRLIPVDFIAVLKSHNPVGDHHSLLFSNCLSQSRALMTGKSLQQAQQEFQAMGYTADEALALAPHKEMPGNRPSNTLVMEQVTPESLGALIALYEHKVYVQSVIWGINAFDQWGVELGKVLCQDIHAVIERQETGEALDDSTMGLIERYWQEHNACK